MIIFSLLMAIIWIFFVFYHLNESVKLCGITILVLNLFSGMMLLVVINWLNSQIVYLVLGGLILISGLRYLQILNKDFFYIFEKWLHKRRRLAIRQLPIFICWLAFLGQWQSHYLENVKDLWLFSIILAGLLQLIIWKRSRIKVLEWQKDLIITLSGLFLVINSLIIMSGDVVFFLHILEKILHII